MFRFKFFTNSFKAVFDCLSKFVETGDVVVPITFLVLSISNALISIDEMLAKVLGGVSFFIIFLYFVLYVFVYIKSFYYFLLVRFRKNRR